MNTQIHVRKPFVGALVATAFLSAAIAVRLPARPSYPTISSATSVNAIHASPTVTLQKVWEYTGNGDWSDVAAGNINGLEQVFACSRGGVTVLSDQGKFVRRLDLHRSVSRLEIGQLDGD